MTNKQSSIHNDNEVPIVDAVGDAFTVSDAVHFDDHHEYESNSVNVGDRDITVDGNDVGEGDKVANCNAKRKNKVEKTK